MTAPLFDVIQFSIKGRDFGLDRNGNLCMRGSEIILSYDTNPVVINTNGGGSGGGGTFGQSCSYTLASGDTHNLGPAPTSGVFVAGTTNRFILTPNAGGSTIDSITTPGTDGFVILLYNSHLTRSVTFLDQNNAGTGGTAGNLLACPNPNGLASNAIEVILPPQSAVKLTYVNNLWVFA